MDLMSIAIVSLLALAALVAAWFAGSRWGQRHAEAPRVEAGSQKYVRGLNFLLNEEPDESLDAFIGALDVTPETLDTHLALGNLMRRRGEVERAIRIHQNLLSRPRLTQGQLHQAQLELGKDFMAAGLLDRAERLMLDVVEMSAPLRPQALKYLIEIYRDEQEWDKAIRAASKLSPRRFGFGSHPVFPEQAHFCCELAEQALVRGEYLQVRRQLRSALKFDKNSVRASLLWGRLELQQGNYKAALKQFEKIVVQDPDYLPEAVGHIGKCYKALGRERELLGHLGGLYERYPNSSLRLALAEQIRRADGDAKAVDFLTVQLRKAPSIKGLIQLLEWRAPGDADRRQDAELIKHSLQRLMLTRPSHRCGHCGFSGRQLHWLCPKCKAWGAVKPILGVEGE